LVFVSTNDEFAYLPVLNGYPSANFKHGIRIIEFSTVLEG